MSCSCLKNDFNVHVDYSDCRTLIISDQSIWMRGEFFDQGESLPVSIMPLSSGKTITVTMYLNKRNLYTSEELLGKSELCLPDDILCLSCASCGVSYSINRAYLCSTLCKIDKLKANAKSTADWEFIRDLQDLVEGITANAELGKVQKASSLLQIINKKLKNVQCGSCS